MADGVGAGTFPSAAERSLRSKGIAQHREVPARGQLRRRPEAQTILEDVATTYGCSKKALLEQGTRGNEARAVAMVLVWDCCGVSLREIGALFGGQVTLPWRK